MSLNAISRCLRCLVLANVVSIGRSSSIDFTLTFEHARWEASTLTMTTEVQIRLDCLPIFPLTQGTPWDFSLDLRRNRLSHERLASLGLRRIPLLLLNRCYIRHTGRLHEILIPLRVELIEGDFVRLLRIRLLCQAFVLDKGGLSGVLLLNRLSPAFFLFFIFWRDSFNGVEGSVWSHDLQGFQTLKWRLF